MLTNANVSAGASSCSLGQVEKLAARVQLPVFPVNSLSGGI